MLSEAAGWIAPAATMLAACMTAANLGPRITGWGFVVFTVGSIGWVVIAVASGQQNLLLSNAFLTVVNLVGIWRWLGRRARYDDGGQAASDASRASSAPTLFALSGIEGKPVTDAVGATVGRVVDGMAECGSGRIAYLVVSQGGVGGLGETLHAVGWREVTVRDDGIATPLPAGALAERPALDATRWPESAAAAGVA